MDRRKLCSDLERCLSLPRLNAYKLTGELDSFNAIARYLWNTALCEALYPTLQAFEVSLRNAIHDSLSSYYRQEWLLAENYFRPKEWDCILKAEGALIDQGKLRAGEDAKPDDLVAELMLGFWTGLFVHAYDRTFAVPITKRGLKGFPNECGLATHFTNVLIGLDFRVTAFPTTRRSGIGAISPNATRNY